MSLKDMLEYVEGLEHRALLMKLAEFKKNPDGTISIPKPPMYTIRSQPEPLKCSPKQ